jgi:protein-disulfide isomerase
MTTSLTRRSLLGSIATVPAALALASCSEGGEANAQTSTPAPGAAAAPAAQGNVDMAKLLEAGTLEDKMIGNADAPVTIVEYASMTCSHCAHFDVATLPTIKEKYLDTGKARLILREFPFDPRAEAGFMLARCSGDNYFAMVDVLFKQQEQWAPVQDAKAALMQISKLAGFTQESFEACLTDQKLLDDIRAVRTRGSQEFGVDATPTFFITGKKYAGALSVDEMSAIIDSLL